MARENQDIDLYAGETLVIYLDVHDEITEAVTDLTTLSTAQFKVKTGSTTSISKTLGSGITNGAPTTGRLTITVGTSDTSALTGEYQMEARLAFADGTTKTVTTGTVRVAPSII